MGTNQPPRRTMTSALVYPELKTTHRLDHNTNFLIWKDKLKFVLWDHKVHYVLSEPKPPEPPEPTGTPPQDDAVARHRKWVDGDYLARHIILGALHERVYMCYQHHKNAKSLLDALTADFGKSPMSKKMAKLRRYVEHKMAEGKSVNEHILEMGSMVYGLESEGVKVSEELQAVMLMNSLPESWADMNTDLDGSNGMILGRVTKKLTEIGAWKNMSKGLNKAAIHFRSLHKPKEDDFSLELSKLDTYDDVVQRVAQQLGLDDPSKIRLTSHSCYYHEPHCDPIKYRGVERLTDMLMSGDRISNILYYEVLDIPLPELEGSKTLTVGFLLATSHEVAVHTLRLPKESTVGDLLNDLKTKVELSHPDAELRLFEVSYHKIDKVFPLEGKIENIYDEGCFIHAEEVPEEEKNLGPNDHLILVNHFSQDTSQKEMKIRSFGRPFVLVIHKGETLAQIKVRMQKKLKAPDEAFAKLKFAYLFQGRPGYFQDSDIVSSQLQRRDVRGTWEQRLRLEHPETPKRAYVANQNQPTSEKRVKI